MKYIKYYFLIALLALTSNACTDLTENVYDQLLTDNFYNNKNEVISAVLRPYTHANAWMTPGQDGWWRVSEFSADQLAWPVKGRHGQDGGKWFRLHYHTWTVDDDFVWNPWRLMWWGLGLCTDPIENLEKRDICINGNHTGRKRFLHCRTEIASGVPLPEADGPVWKHSDRHEDRRTTQSANTATRRSI